MRLATLSSGLLLAAARVALVRADDSGTAWCTPHDSYSSSVGVLGCKINTNRVAYWPGTVDCTNLCVEVSYSGRSVYLLRIDQSGGAHDISYDAWNYLITGQSAAKKPTTGGATAMTYQNVDASKCASLIKTKGGKLPLSAANSMDFLASCLADESSWVAKHYVLYNILDPICTWGYDETCKLDWPNANQAACPHTLGEPVALTKDPVWNIQYGTGKSVLAGSSPSSTTPNSLSNAATSAGQTVRQPGVNLLAAVIAVSGLFIHSLLDFL